MTDGKVYVIDAAAGRMLGLMSTGYAQMAVEIAPDFSSVYVPITFYSRGTYGERTDAVVIYETENLSPVAEVIIPGKRATGMPMRGYSGMSDDGRFVYVNNMTPATSVSVVNVADRVSRESIRPVVRWCFPQAIAPSRAFAATALCSRSWSTTKVQSRSAQNQRASSTPIPTPSPRRHLAVVTPGCTSLSRVLCIR
ncbi:MAG: hypothetical protein HC809_05680 [Gammaproteobacteria bacterium]|nr:hypothetical protein [Gammaproteobacteria bacterium]